MKEFLDNIEESIVLCNHLIADLKEDMDSLKDVYDGAIYEEYRKIVCSEIYKVVSIKNNLKWQF